MKVLCNNTKGYALTKGKEYRVVRNNKDRYVIINDNGIQKKYGKNLFSEQSKKADGEVPEQEIIEEPKKIWDHQDILNSVKVSENNNTVTIKYNESENEQRTIRIDIHDSNVSCGIKELGQLNALLGQIFRSAEVNIDLFTVDFMNKLLTEILMKIKEIFQDERICGLIIMSTNVRSSEDPDDHLNYCNIPAITAMSSAHNTTFNPNSGNYITTWMFDIEVEPEEED